MTIVFSAISPHPPIILSSVGSKEDLSKVEKTIESLYHLREKFLESDPEQVIVFSPHLDWGFDVPLHFLAKDFQGKIQKVLIGPETPRFYFEQGKELCSKLDKNKKYALIASGDLSHRLKEDGPYGFHPDGPKFDKALIELLKAKETEAILKLNETYPEAAECGLRSFCFLLGVLQSLNINWQVEIMSYENPFGVGYLTADFKIL